MFVERFWLVLWEVGTGGVSDRMSVTVEAGRCVFTGDGSGAYPGLNINYTLAVSLRGVCDIRTPPVSICTGSGSKTTPWSEVISNKLQEWWR
ncbi:hypothetical protein HanPSC8_Chr02g0072251 [Helianthus annuus]|nr:hypothetical protein HanPSC8_Chr02g0072251 [Helianthus annuus]